MPQPWYVRPVLFVSDGAAAHDFYLNTLGFQEDWMHEEDGKPLVFQVSRDGLEVILNDVRAEAGTVAGKGRLFMALDETGARKLGAELSARGANVTERRWGFPVVQVLDPDGNQLFFVDNELNPPRD